MSDKKVLTRGDSDIGGDHENAIHYEDCTGAAFRIRKGIAKTPLQVLYRLDCVN